MTETLPGPPAHEVDQAHQTLVEQAKVYFDANIARNTARAYLSDWRDFQSWCVQQGLSALPPSATTLALYLSDRATTCSVSTLSRRLAGIRAALAGANVVMPVSETLRRVWAGIRRTRGRPPRTKRAITLDELRRMVAALPGTMTGHRDRALILVGFAAALRRGELAALCLGERAGSNVTATFVTAGLEIGINRSKGDQEGRGVVVAVPYGTSSETCPVTALQRWLDVSGISDGPAFRRVNRRGSVGRSGISPQTVTLITKAAVAAIGLDPLAFAGHSLRAGLATAAAARDAPAHVIMAHMRHASFDTTRRYIREADRFRVNAANIAGL